MKPLCTDGQDETSVQGASRAMYIVGFLPGVNTERNQGLDGHWLMGQDDQGVGRRSQSSSTTDIPLSRTPSLFLTFA